MLNRYNYHTGRSFSVNANLCVDILNRYLRITVPLGLAVAVYVGLVPLLLTGSMGAAALATQEAEYCKQVQYSTVQCSTVQYSTVQYMTSTASRTGSGTCSTTTSG